MTKKPKKNQVPHCQNSSTSQPNNRTNIDTLTHIYMISVFHISLFYGAVLVVIVWYIVVRFTTSYAMSAYSN